MHLGGPEVVSAMYCLHPVKQQKKLSLTRYTLSNLNISGFSDKSESVDISQ